MESKTCGFFGSISPNRKQPKKATQQAVQKVWNISFILHSFFSLDLMDFRTSKVIAFLTEVALLFLLLEFFNLLRRVEVTFLLLLNFLNPRKL